MTVNIEKMRADMRWETKKFVVSAILVAATFLGAGGVIGGVVVDWILMHDRVARIRVEGPVPVQSP